MSHLQCDGIVKHLGGKPVLKGLGLSVAPGEVVSLLGASGSGKTTLLRAIAGLIHPDAGRITLGGTEVFGPGVLVPAERRRIGMVFQDYALWPHMTVEGNLAFALSSQRLAPAESRARIAHALEVTRLSEYAGRHPQALSGGQQQRVAIARCLASRPALMLFDEPLSNLDAALREDLRVEMMDLVRREATTVVYVTHDQAEAMAVSDRIAVMRLGEIAQCDRPEVLYDRPATPFVASFIGGFSLLTGQGPGAFRIGTQTLALRAPNGPAVVVVRPEDARPFEAHPETQLHGRVQSAAYQGRCWRLIVVVEGQSLRIDWPRGAEPGSPLAFSLPPDRCQLLALEPQTQPEQA